MINAIGTTLLSSTAASDKTGQTTGSGFDAALAAAQKAEERASQFQSDLDAIRDKGFSAWARDTQVEALKEKLRQKIMAEMGIDEQSLSSLSATMREILEQKIEEEVTRRMEEEMAKTATDNGQSQGTAAAQVAQAAQAGKNDRPGKDVPVISAASWPGAASLF